MLFVESLLQWDLDHTDKPDHFDKYSFMKLSPTAASPHTHTHTEHPAGSLPMLKVLNTPPPKGGK